MDTLLRFGSGDQLYTFSPDDQVQIRDNFRNVVTRTSRLPGLSGGFDEYGVSPAPAEVGNVQATFWVLADTVADMQAAKESFSRMKSFGKKRLYKQPEDPAQSERYCEARVNSIDFNENTSDRPHKYLRVTINFQVDNPYWLTQGTEAPSYGDGTTYNSGAAYGGTPVTYNVIGTDNSYSLAPSGNDIIYPRLTLEVPTGESASNINIQRLENGNIRDQVRWSGTLASEDLLEINCRAYNVWLNGVAGYGDDFSFETAAWFSLVAGQSNTINVSMANASDQVTLKIRYYEAYNV